MEDLQSNSSCAEHGARVVPGGMGAYVVASVLKRCLGR